MDKETTFERAKQEFMNKLSSYNCSYPINFHVVVCDTIDELEQHNVRFLYLKHIFVTPHDLTQLDFKYEPNFFNNIKELQSNLHEINELLTYLKEEIPLFNAKYSYEF